MRLTFSNNEIILASTDFYLLRVELGRDMTVHPTAYVTFSGKSDTPRGQRTGMVRAPWTVTQELLGPLVPCPDPAGVPAAYSA